MEYCLQSRTKSYAILLPTSHSGNILTWINKELAFRIVPLCSERFARGTWGFGCHTAHMDASLKAEVKNCCFEVTSGFSNRAVYYSIPLFTAKLTKIPATSLSWFEMTCPGPQLICTKLHFHTSLRANSVTPLAEMFQPAT